MVSAHRSLRIAAMLSLAAISPHALASQVRIDFGSAASPTVSTASQFWNNVTNPINGTTKLIDFASGKATPWSLEVTRPFNGIYDNNGATKPISTMAQSFGSSATRDSFDAYTSLSSPQITLRNLPVTDSFSFNIASSFMGGSANRTGTFTVRGATTSSGSINATNNASNLLTFNSIKPAKDGTIRLDISGASINNSQWKQVYLNGLTITSTSPVTPPPPVPGKNLLFFGNSFTQLSNMPTMVGTFAVADGQTQPYIVAETADSRGLEDQLYQVATNPQNNIDKIPAGKTWDYVVMQDFSSNPTHNGDPAGFRSNATALFNAVKAKSPSVKPVLYETWAYRPTSTAFYDATPEAGQWTNAAQMQAELKANYLAAKADLDAIDGNTTVYAGVGDKWQQAGWSDDLFDTYDDKHPSTRGSALAALVLYASIYKENVSDIAYAKVQPWADQYGISQADWTRLTTLVDTTPALATAASYDAMLSIAHAALIQNAIPEPTSLLAMMLGLSALARRRRV